jgi:dinuclear metal center YbgI/SA1388 family protein
MLLRELIAAMEDIAPTKYAESWDNVGLLAGDPAQNIAKILLTIDYNPAVAEEARHEHCDAIISYHPPIFDAIKRLTAPSLIFDAIRRGVAIYSPHTAFDVADGGANDFLADVLGMATRSPLKLAQTKATQYKLVTFVSEDHVDRVSQALFSAGAGRIGAYSSCSFRSPGTGTFFGDESTNPAIGKKGALERQPEIRVETVVPIASIEAVIHALRESHPYEEPAFDLNQLAAAPEGVGVGRVGTLAPTAREALFQKIKSSLSLAHLLIAGPTTGTITRAACCAGAGGSLLPDALREKAELYLTGEIRHHDALAAARAGMTIVCTLHSNSERPALVRLKEKLEKTVPVPVLISREDRDPFAIQ